MSESLFDALEQEAQPTAAAAFQPLASRMRPARLEDFIGQEHLLGPGKPLGESIRRGTPHSMILWGPPGVGKTTLARMLAHASDGHFESISAAAPRERPAYRALCR